MKGNDNLKTGLVLEGGAMRGIYTAGVLDVFLDKNIKFDVVVGVSAGAIHGCTYLAAQNGRNIRYYKKYCRDRRFMSLYSLITTGSLVGEQFCYHDIPDRLDPFDYETFRNCGSDFYAVCTDVEKGTPVYVKIDDMKTQINYLLASASMPMVSKTVELGGRKLLDGGVSDSIPFKAAEKLGCDRIVVVQTREEGYRKSPEGNFVSELMYKKYPDFAKAIRNRHIQYNSTLDYISRAEKNGEIVVIRPTRHVDIKRTEKNPEIIEKMYQLGRADAEEKAESVMHDLNVK